MLLGELSTRFLACVFFEGVELSDISYPKSMQVGLLHKYVHIDIAILKFPQSNG